MWIKSQSGEVLVNTDRVKLDCKSILTTQNGNIEVVAMYETKEAAQKEFENIEFAIITNKNFYEIGEDK